MAAVAQVATELQKRLHELTTGLAAVMAREIEGLDNDPVLLDSHCGTASSPTSRQSSMAWPTRPDQPAATTVGSGGVRGGAWPSAACRRTHWCAYHMGQHDLLNEFYPLVEALRHPRTHRRSPQTQHALVWAYIDWISIYVFEVYESERNLWLGAAANIHSALIHGLQTPPPIRPRSRRRPDTGSTSPTSPR